MRPELRAVLITNGLVLGIILIVAGIAEVASLHGNDLGGAGALLGGLTLLTVLVKLYLVPFVTRGRLPSGRTVGDWRASRLPARQRRAALRARRAAGKKRGAHRSKAIPLDR
jgi:hypothetical protein